MSDINKVQDSGRGQSWLCKWATVSAAAAEMNRAHGGGGKQTLSSQTYVAVMVIKHIVIQSHGSSTALLKPPQTRRETDAQSAETYCNMFSFHSCSENIYISSSRDPDSLKHVTTLLI